MIALVISMQMVNHHCRFQERDWHSDRMDCSWFRPARWSHRPGRHDYQQAKTFSFYFPGNHPKRTLNISQIKLMNENLTSAGQSHRPGCHNCHQIKLIVLSENQYIGNPEPLSCLDRWKMKILILRLMFKHPLSGTPVERRSLWDILHI